jgi:ABC-type polysaccharide transport system permease subunit
VWGSVLGVAFGVVVGLIDALLIQVVRRTPANRTLTIQVLNSLALPNMLLWVAIASFLAGALSKHFASGIIAGVALAVVAQELSFLFSALLLPRTLPAQAIIQVALQTLLTGPVLLAAGLGAGGGALGALLGQAMARRAPAPTSSPS